MKNSITLHQKQTVLNAKENDRIIPSEITPLHSIIAGFSSVFFKLTNKMESDFEMKKTKHNTLYHDPKLKKHFKKWRQIKGVLRFLMVMKSVMHQKRLLGLSSEVENIRNKDNSKLKIRQICEYISGKKKEHEKQQQARKWYIIYENTLLSKIGDCFMLFFFGYIAIYFPFKMSFLYNSYPPSVDYLFDVLTFVNIFITVLVANPTKTNGIDDIKKLTKQYLKTYFVFDFLSLIPFYLIFSNSQSNHLRNQSLLQLTRFLRLGKIIDRLKNNFVIKKTKSIFEVNKRFLQLSNFCLFVVLFLHELACILFYLTTINPDSENWLNKGLLYDYPFNLWGNYIVSVYSIVTTVCMVGFGDIVPVTTLEKLVEIILVFFGMCFYSYTLGTLSSILSEANNNLSIVSHRFAFLNSFANERPIDPRLLEKLTVNLEFFEQIEDVDNTELSKNFLMSISLDLTYEIAKHIHRDLIRKVLFFQNKDINFVSQILPFFKPRKYQEKETIYGIGEHSSFVYFLMEGRVEFSNTLSKIFKVYVDGSYFGEIEVLKGCVRQFTARAQTDVEVLMLPREVFIQQIESFPEIKNEILNIAMRRDLINKRSQIVANKLHFMNYSGHQNRDELTEYEILRQQCEENIAMFKEKVVQITNQVKMSTTEMKTSMKGKSPFTVNLTGDSGFNKELEEEIPLSKKETNGFLMTQKPGLDFLAKFGKMIKESEQNKVQMTELCGLFRKNRDRLRKKKFKVEQGVQAIVQFQNEINSSTDFPLVGIGKNHNVPKSMFFSHNSFGGINNLPEIESENESGPLKKKYSKMSKDFGKIEEMEEEDSGKEEKISLSYLNLAEDMEQSRLSKFDSFSNQKATVMRILLKRKDVIRNYESVAGISNSSKSSIQEM